MNFGRFQLRAFLREAGLGLDEARQWWQEELCRDAAITPDIFRSKYAYDVEHAHGARGHGRGAFVSSCKTMAESRGRGPRQVHGCPFCTDSEGTSLPLVLPLGAPPAAAAVIDAVSVREGAGAACAAFFHATLPGAQQRPRTTHPMQYLRASRAYHRHRRVEVAPDA